MGGGALTTEPEQRRDGPGRRSSDHLVRLALSAMFVALLIAAGTIVALVVQGSDNSSALGRASKALQHANSALGRANAALDVQHRQLVQGCERLNTKQREDNRDQQADYFYDKIFFDLVSRQHPRSAKQREQTREFLGPLRVALHAKAWVPLVPDCANVGPRYRPPLPIAFAQRQPPRSQITPPK